DSTRGAMSAEVDHRRLELAELAEQIERFGRPSGHEIEAVSEAAALQLHLDRARFAVECEPIGTERIGGQEQDRVLHRRPLRGELGIGVYWFRGVCDSSEPAAECPARMAAARPPCEHYARVLALASRVDDVQDRRPFAHCGTVSTRSRTRASPRL